MNVYQSETLLNDAKGLSRHTKTTVDKKSDFIKLIE